MTEFLKPSDLNKVWSNAGDNIAPSDAKINSGWAVEIPARQHFNYIDNKQDQAIAHINQHGIAVWDNTTEYQAGKSYVTGSNGHLYVALQTHTNQNPTTDVSEVYWADVLKANQVLFTAPGVSSWTVPLILKLGVRRATVTVVGAGGGGGGSTATASFGAAAGGGGGGGYTQSVIDLTGTTSVSITIGTGGSASANGAGTATAGGTSSFGALLSATGGAGGNSATAGASTAVVGAGQVGGQGVGGSLAEFGGHGQHGVAGSPTVASTPVGGGAGGASIISGPSASSGLHGAGGTGGAAQAGAGSGAGGPGGNGIVIIRW